MVVYMPVIPVTQETESGGSQLRAAQVKGGGKTLSQKQRGCWHSSSDRIIV
jgi:hypothetical protein